MDEETFMLGAGEEGLDLAFARSKGDDWPLAVLSDWQREELEIAKMYREADERFFAQEALRFEQAEDAEARHWEEIEKRLSRRDRRKRKRSH